MTAVLHQRRALRFVGRSYMAFVFAAETPIAEWLAELDTSLARSPGFFAGRPVVLDLSAVKLSKAGIAHLISCLEERNIRIMGLEGADPAELGPELPPLLRGGRAASVGLAPVASEKPSAPKQPSSLLLETSVRSGQSVVFAEGDVTILGSIGSGAEVLAGGSIHVYGTLRGSAMAGITGNPRARIFCHKMEAELLAIDGYYRTAEDIDAKLHSRPTQAWLDGSAMMITALN